MSDEQKRMLTAVVLSAAILFAWQKFFAPESVTTLDNTQQSINKEESKPNADMKTEQVLLKSAAVSAIKIENEIASYEVSNLLNISPLSSKFSDLPFEEVVGTKNPYRLEFLVGDNFREVDFTLVKNGESGFTGVSAEGIKLSGSIDDKGNLNINFKSAADFKYRFLFQSKEKKLENNQIRRYAFYTDELETIDVGDEERTEAKISWLGIDFNYHLFAFSFDKAKDFMFEARENGAFLAQRSMSSNEFSLTVTYTKKDYDRLSTLGNHLNGSVDFGIWKIIAVPILRGLQFFYDLIANYGVAIILLTLVIRLITFPLQYKSFKSMKKMQTIQPELTKLRAEFKDDPQRMQKESMELFKRTGANPLGGCLPLLLQMPVFFAFYKVLYSAVELVGAPFIFWIQDLSIKDPYYVLPVLMALAMFAQQKLTPTTTADPTQKKVMMFMPLIFGLIMKDLPAGLCLYIFVSTLFGMLQQLFVYRTVD